MILRVFSVYDDKAAAFLPPFFERSEGSALRAFINAANDEKHAFFNNAADYSLFVVGTFDDSSGLLEATIPPRALARASEMKQTGI